MCQALWPPILNPVSYLGGELRNEGKGGHAGDLHMADGDLIIIGQANTASNPGNETSLSRNEGTARTVFAARTLNVGDGMRAARPSAAPACGAVAIAAPACRAEASAAPASTAKAALTLAWGLQQQQPRRVGRQRIRQWQRHAGHQLQHRRHRCAGQHPRGLPWPRSTTPSIHQRLLRAFSFPWPLRLASGQNLC